MGPSRAGLWLCVETEAEVDVDVESDEGELLRLLLPVDVVEYGDSRPAGEREVSADGEADESVPASSDAVDDPLLSGIVSRSDGGGLWLPPPLLGKVLNVEARGCSAAS